MSSSPSDGIGAKFLLVSAALVIIFAGLQAAQKLLAPLFLAVFLALILTPPLRWLKQKGLPDVLAILVLSTFVFLMGLGVVLIFTNSLTHFASKLPSYTEKVAAAYTTIDDSINHIADKFSAFTQFNSNDIGAPKTDTETEPAEEETETVAEPTNGVQEDPAARERLSLSNVIQVNTLISYVQLVANMLLNLVTFSSLVIIMVVFMLFEAARLPDKIKEAFAGRDLSNEYLKKIADDTWNYMKIKTIVSFLTGLFTSIGLWFLGIEYPLLWGLLMFFLNYIPNIGQVIASIPPILLALIDGGVFESGLLMAALVTAWLILVNTFFGIGVEPRYLGQGLDISTTVVLLSLMFWGWLLGLIGMFLSAPLTMVVKIVLQNDPKTRWLAVLLSNR